MNTAKGSRDNMLSQPLKNKIDWFSTIVPLTGVIILCAFFMVFPEQSALILQQIREFLGDECGIYYALLGTGIFGCTIYMAFSQYGRIQLEKSNLETILIHPSIPLFNGEP